MQIVSLVTVVSYRLRNKLIYTQGKKRISILGTVTYFGKTSSYSKKYLARLWGKSSYSAGLFVKEETTVENVEVQYDYNMNTISYSFS